MGFVEDISSFISTQMVLTTGGPIIFFNKWLMRMNSCQLNLRIEEEQVGEPWGVVS